MGLTALAVSIAPPPATQRRAAEPSPTPSPAPSPAPAQAAEPGERETVPGEPPLTVLSARQGGQVVRLRVGDRLRLQVESPTLDSVQVGDDGPIEAVDPNSPAEFELLVDEEASLPVRLLDSGRIIGRLEVAGAE
jgi:hypothetical protein